MRNDLYNKLWSHQKEAVDRFSATTYLALFFEMGCGKTATSIACLLQKIEEEGRFLRTLILCPPIVVENWARELEKFAGLGKKVLCLSGSGNQQARLLENAHNTPIVIAPHSSISSSKAAREALLRYPVEFLIFDESHRAKGAKTNLSKNTHIIADKAKYKLILSGSPILNGEEDLWSQMRILSPSLVGANFFSWQKKNFYNVNATKHWVNFPCWKLTEDGARRVEAMLEHVAMRVKKSEVLDLPPLVKQEVFIEPSKQVQKHYQEMEKGFVTYVRDDVCEAPLFISKMLRLQQIVSGVVQGEDEVHEIETNKDEALRELLSELCPRNKVVVWCNFRLPLQRLKKLCQKIGLYYCSIEGGQKKDERQEQIDKFNDRGSKYSVMLANQQAGGVGIGLQAASYMIYYSKDYNLEKDIQSEARAHRGGSEIHESVTRIDLITRGTIEEDITQALKEKLEIGEMMFRMKEKYSG